MIRAVGQCACAEDARGNGGAGVAGRSVPRWRDEAGAGIHSEDVTPSLRLFVAFVVDVVGPAAETSLDRVELRGSDAVGRNLCRADAVCSAQTLCKESYVEACVAFLKEFDEARIADRSGGADRIDVEIVAGVAPGVQGAEFVADGVLDVENGANAEADRRVGAPVDSEINAEWRPVWWGDGELAEEELARSTVTS